MRKQRIVKRALRKVVCGEYKGTLTSTPLFKEVLERSCEEIYHQFYFLSSGHPKNIQGGNSRLIMYQIRIFHELQVFSSPSVF